MGKAEQKSGKVWQAYLSENFIDHILIQIQEAEKERRKQGERKSSKSGTFRSEPLFLKGCAILSNNATTEGQEFQYMNLQNTFLIHDTILFIVALVTITKH